MFHIKPRLIILAFFMGLCGLLTAQPTRAMVITILGKPHVVPLSPFNAAAG